MNFPWNLFVDLGVISLGMLLATLIRAKITFFQKYLIPNALTAGFILLPIYNFVFPKIGIDSQGLGTLVYHLLNISFISMTLRKSPPTPPQAKGNNRVFSTSLAILSQFALQAIVGLLLTFLFIKTLFPDLFPAFGFLLPLGFVQGPGQAYAIGQGWESLGFAGAGSVGLTFAAIGFLWACFGGVFLINYGIRKKWMGRELAEKLNSKGIRTGILGKNENLPVGTRLTTETEAIDSMTFNTAMVLAVYLLSYLLLKLITHLLSYAGPLGEQLAVNLWGIAYIFCAITTLLLKGFIKKLKFEHTLDNGSLTRISGFSVDVMVTASIAAISIVVVKEYWLPILLLCVVAGTLVMITVPWLCSRLFRDHRFHRTMMIFGVSTGTMPTGLALLRVIDPDFETPVATDYMYAAGLTFVFAIPFILSINLPVYAHTTGNFFYFWLALFVSIGYLLFVIIAYTILSRKRAYMNPARVWLGDRRRRKKQ